MKTWRISCNSSALIEAETAEQAKSQFIDDLDEDELDAVLDSDDGDDDDELEETSDAGTDDHE